MSTISELTGLKSCPRHAFLYPASGRCPYCPKPLLSGGSYTMALTAPVASKPRATPKPKTTTPLPQDWSDALKAIASGARRVLLHGIPGTGKTYAAQNFGVHRGDEVKVVSGDNLRTPEDVFNIYLGEETAAYQIVGTDAIEHGTMVWRNGPGLLAWRRAQGRCVINEIDHASGDALDALMWLCDDEQTARIVLPTGEEVRPACGVQFVATMNGEPQDLPDALQDRFATRVRITAPHPDAILALPKELHAVAKNLTTEDTPESQRISIRQFRAYAELIELGVDKHAAARCSFYHRADELLKTIALAKA